MMFTTLFIKTDSPLSKVTVTRLDKLLGKQCDYFHKEI